MQTRKYGRTYHFPFSPGVSSDDKILQEWEGILEHEIVLTEKLDGENTCLKSTGVYARSHGAPTRNPWASNMWPIWERVCSSLGDLEVFGENIYGLHSIEYLQAHHHFYVFAIREGDMWLSWEEVQFMAEALELPTTPVREIGHFSDQELEQCIHEQMKMGSSLSALKGECEGFVARKSGEFHEDEFKFNVIKYVRKNHVKTDQHWTRNWQRAKLWYERAHR